MREGERNFDGVTLSNRVVTNNRVSANLRRSAPASRRDAIADLIVRLNCRDGRGMTAAQGAHKTL
jgi:hypothetical protein